MMVPSVIQYDHDTSSLTTSGLLELLEKNQKGFGIELVIFSVISKLAVAQTDGSKIAYAFTGGLMEHHGIDDFRCNPHTTPRAMLLKMNFIFCPEIDPKILHESFQFFLCLLCNSGSALAIRGRGLRNRKPNCRNNRWHWRTPSSTRNCFSMNADRLFPSHRFSPKPAAFGVWRRTRLISANCFSPKAQGRPGRSPSTIAAKPSFSKRFTQYWTARGESPKSCATPRQLSPWATSSNPCNRWSYRDSSERRISSCNPSMISGSVMVSGFMKP